jgi:hypothetical protein
MHVKNRTTKMDPKPNFYMLSKEDLLVCAFYKLKYLSYLAVMLPKFLKSCLPGARLIKPNC